MQRRRMSWLSHSIVGLLSFISGALVLSFFGDRAGTKFWELRFIEVLNLFFYIIAVFLVSYYLTQRHSNDRRRLDFLFTRSKQLKEQIQRDFNNLHECLNKFDDKTTRNRVLMSCKSLDNAVDALSSVTKNRDAAKPHAEELAKHVVELQRTLTGDKWENIDELTTSDIQQVERIVRNIDNSLDRYMLAIFS